MLPGEVNYQCPGAYPRTIPPNPPCPAAMLPDGPAIRAGAATGPARAAGPTAGPASTAPYEPKKYREVIHTFGIRTNK